MRWSAWLALFLVAGCSEPDPVERARVLPAVAMAERDRAGDVVLCVDTARSLVRWRGTKVGGSHEGVVRFRGGHVRLEDEVVVGGELVVDMRTIAITDIPQHEVEARRNLRSHLAHEEFFGVDRFPTARLELTDIEAGSHGVYGVAGNLAIRDSVHNVTFDAMAPVRSADQVWATASFGIDRHRWGIDFDGRTSALRNAIVHDLIQLEITVLATRAACAGGSSSATPTPPRR